MGQPLTLPSTRRYLGGLASYYALDLLRLGAYFAITPWLLRYLGEERFGVQVTVIALVGYLGLLDLGLSSVLTKYLAEERARGGSEAISRIAASAFWCCVATGLVGGGVVLVLSGHVELLFRGLGEANSEEATVFLLLMGASFMLALPASILSAVPYAHERVDLMNGVRIIQLAVLPAAAIATIVLDLGLIGIACGNIGAAFVGGFGNLLLCRRLEPTFSLSIRLVSLAEVRRLFSYGLLFFINGISVLLVFRTDSIVISIGLGAAAVSLYAIIAGTAMQMMQLVFKIGDTLFPTYTKLYAAGQPELAQRAFLRALRYTVLVGGLLAALFCVLGRDFFTLWLGAEVVPQGVVYIFGVMILIHGVAHVSGMFVAAIGGLRRIVWWSVLEGFLNLGLSLVLLWRFGLLGVAVATLVAQLATTAWIYPRVAGQLLPSGRPGLVLATLLKPALMVFIGSSALWFLCAALLRDSPEPVRLAAGGAALLVLLGLGILYERRDQLSRRRSQT